MATKPKESSTLIGSEKKKVSSSSSPLTTTKRITKPSTTTPTTTNKSNTTPLEKNSPSYLKPTTSFNKPKTETPIKPAPIRRRSLDKPLSSSNLTTKQKQPSPSRLHKALVSPGPRERSASLIIRSSNPPVKSINPSKPISDKTPSDAKTKLLWKKTANKITTPNNNIATSNTTKKVTNDHASSAKSAIPTKIKGVTAETSNVETEDVKEVTNQEVEVIKVENEEHVSHEISPDVNSEELLHENEQILEDSDTPHNQVDDEKVISTVSEEEVAEKEAQEEKPEVEHEEKENSNENQPEEVEHSEVEGEVDVNEKEENESGIGTEDQKSENNNEEEQGGEKNEAVEGGVSEEVEETKTEVEQEQPKQQSAAVVKGKKESQVSNDMIEETASKLLGRKNKVLALAGAFQTVIDHQTK